MTFLPRAMEWHFGLVALIALGVFLPWALAVAGLGLIYTAVYCMVCASQAKLDVLETTHGPCTALRRLQWRGTIAWLNFLEPLARDWGRLKGGLSPWRSARVEGRPETRPSQWWQRLHPFRRRVKWAYPGNMGLEKNAFLDRMTSALVGIGCAVGWNPDSEVWDVKVRRGTLGEATLSVVIEHHGGPKRVARFQMTTQPPQVLYWLYTILAGLTGLTAALSGSTLAITVLALALLILWVAPIREANRLEAAIRFAADEVAGELQEPYTHKLVQRTGVTPQLLAQTAKAGD